MQISNWLTNISRGWVAILATMIFILFMALVLPGQAQAIAQVSKGAGSPDTSFWYSPDDLYQQAEIYGQAGRDFYIRARWTFDLVYPVIYAFFLVTSTSWIYAQSVSPRSPWRLANLVPLFAMILDYMENSATSLVMARYPELTPLAALAATFLTPMKWLFVSCSFGFLVLGVILIARSRLQQHTADTDADRR